MSNNNAYVYPINPIGSGVNENGQVHQTSPHWVLSFVRWQIRDTLRTKATNGVDFTTVTAPLVVENDCLQVSTTQNKGTLTPSMSATLIMTDINYATAIAPGDFVFVNMLNWPSEARRVADQARALSPINGFKDGFKGLFKIQGVRKALVVDSATGTKMNVFRITGFAFTEFNNTIYFNPYMIDNAEQNSILFASLIGRDWSLIVNKPGSTNVQDILKLLIESFIGSGISDQGRADTKIAVRTPNVHFYMPKTIGNLLGVKGLKAAKDIYVYLFGIQSYAAGASQTPATGLNPQGVVNPTDGRFINTGINCQGDVVAKPEYWNQVKAWSILNQFTNSPLNELYTCFRTSPSGKVMPTVVFRQIPFTTEDFETGSFHVTYFMNLPRWKVNPSLILEYDLGRDESARINFVQYFGRSTYGLAGQSVSEEIARKNYLYDIDDVKRSGLRSYIINSQFDEIPETGAGRGTFRAPEWAKIIGDSLIGGHLKFSGTIVCAGLVDPIAVGDNLEFDGAVYHLEQISHTCQINPFSGVKTFRTTLSVSSGVSKQSSTKRTAYSEMNYGQAYDLRENDYKYNKILPGVSESQATEYRPDNLDEPRSDSSSFPQPNDGTAINKSTRTNNE